ncbi:acyltransferase family protein [Hymenobacter terrenus]|uniref:acyltransferase family protein n=1 Tax=Hymenobacter terrenus TaxID=1629124 RepID=UPI000619B488|nr:acyltransferase [Hymenobacter terrenus]
MHTSRPVPSTVQFRGLDVLRCCAALAVVVYHSTLNFKAFLPKALTELLHNLPIGVDFFFLISGFLITYLLLAEKDNTGSISLRRFYIRRSLRIFPLYYAIIALAWVLHHHSNPEVNFYSFLYFAGNFWMVDHSWTVATLNPLWSLCIEEQFYLLIPLLILLIPTRRLPWLFGGIVVLSIAFRAYITITVQYNWMIIYCHTLSRCDILALGGWLAWRHFNNPINLQLPRWTLFAALLYLTLLLAIIDMADFTSLTFAVFKKYLPLLPLAFIFCMILFNNAEQATTAPTTMGKTVNYLGKISYGLYMYHCPIIYVLDTHPHFFADNQILRLLMIIGLTICVAALSYELFEKQILRLKRKFEVVRTVRA